MPVVSVVGDGSFLFSGPQPLWSMARYKAPVTVIVLNNHSYNNERNRIWNGAGRQFEAARDMTCYNGSPDVDFAKAADAFGVEGETVKEPAALAGASLAPKSRRWRGGLICSTSTSSAKASARSRIGIRPIRSPLCGRGRCNHASCSSGLVALALASCCSPALRPAARNKAPIPLPPGDGRDLVAVACSQCHYLGTIAKIRDGAAGWRIYVSNMVLRGAQLTPAEVDKVVNYLSINLGPGINLRLTVPLFTPTASLICASVLAWPMADSTAPDLGGCQLAKAGKPLQLFKHSGCL